jgi:hypothetical protein
MGVDPPARCGGGCAHAAYCDGRAAATEPRHPAPPPALTNSGLRDRLFWKLSLGTKAGPEHVFLNGQNRSSECHNSRITRVPLCSHTKLELAGPINPAGARVRAHFQKHNLTLSFQSFRLSIFDSGPSASNTGFIRGPLTARRCFRGRRRAASVAEPQPAPGGRASSVLRAAQRRERAVLPRHALRVCVQSPHASCVVHPLIRTEPSCIMRRTPPHAFVQSPHASCAVHPLMHSYRTLMHHAPYTPSCIRTEPSCIMRCTPPHAFVRSRVHPRVGANGAIQRCKGANRNLRWHGATENGP